MNLQDLLTPIGDLNLLGSQSTPLLLLAMMGLSLACSFLVSFLYVRFYGRRTTGSRIHRAFPLIGISVTAIFIAIQFSLPLSLGLLGALSIVRFRTPIKEPEEIGFILVVVAVALTCATANLVLLAIILGVALLALGGLAIPRLLGRPSNEGMFIVSLPTEQYREKGGEVIRLLGAALPGGRVQSIAGGDGESTISYRFDQLDVDRLLGVQNEIEKIAEQATANVFFDRSETL